jgi:hypothetical protein
MRTTVLSPFGSSLYPLQTLPRGHLFPVGEPDVSLGIPLLLASMPLWHALFLPGHDECELRLHILFCVAGKVHLPLQFLQMMVAQ